jgi:branched-chain amino acid transport system permease protein
MSAPAAITKVPAHITGHRNASWEYAGLVLLVIWPFFASQYGAGLITEVFVFAIVAMSLDLLIGYGGLVSFGHAAFFGVGAYATVLLSVKLGIGVWPALCAGIVFSAAAAAVIGYMCVRMAGVAFFMLTLAFAQLLFSMAMKWRNVTGGSDGVGGMVRPSFFGMSLTDPTVMYFVCLAAFVLSLVLLRRVIHSQFGHALVGLRDNETRMRALGHPTGMLKLMAFVIGGAFAGFGGGLYAIYNGFVSPDALSFGLSGTFLLMVVLGGSGSLIGPAIGAGVFLLLKQLVSSHTEHWLLIVGVVFIGCVMFFRGGIHGLIERVRLGGRA